MKIIFFLRLFFILLITNKIFAQNKVIKFLEPFAELKVNKNMILKGKFFNNYFLQDVCYLQYQLPNKTTCEFRIEMYTNENPYYKEFSYEQMTKDATNSFNSVALKDTIKLIEPPESLEYQGYNYLIQKGYVRKSQKFYFIITAYKKHPDGMILIHMKYANIEFGYDEMPIKAMYDVIDNIRIFSTEEMEKMENEVKSKFSVIVEDVALDEMSRNKSYEGYVSYTPKDNNYRISVEFPKDMRGSTEMILAEETLDQKFYIYFCDIKTGIMRKICNLVIQKGEGKKLRIPFQIEYYNHNSIDEFKDLIYFNDEKKLKDFIKNNSESTNSDSKEGVKNKIYNDFFESKQVNNLDSLAANQAISPKQIKKSKNFENSGRLKYYGKTEDIDLKKR